MHTGNLAGCLGTSGLFFVILVDNELKVVRKYEKIISVKVDWFNCVLWQGHEGLYSVYVHASKRAELKSVWNSSVFINQEIRSQEVLFSSTIPSLTIMENTYIP